MENTFSFKGSEVNITKPEGTGNTTQWIKPNIHDLQITGWELKKAGSGSLFIEATNTNPAGEVVLRQYWLNTVINPGKTKAAFTISKESMKKLAICLGKEEQFNALEAHSEDEFATKTGALFMGAKFRNKVKGKEVQGKNGIFVKSEMSDAFESISIPMSQTRLKFDPTVDIKRLSTGSFEVKAEVPTGDVDDLPF